MSRSSARRGQIEPLAALAAVVVLGFALAMYAGTLGSVTPEPTARTPETPALRRTLDALRSSGVVRPDRLANASGIAPAGYSVNVSLRAAGHRWETGPPRPRDGNAAAGTVPVRLAPGRVVPGRLRVVVWP